MPNIITNHAITYTNSKKKSNNFERNWGFWSFFCVGVLYISVPVNFDASLLMKDYKRMEEKLPETFNRATSVRKRAQRVCGKGNLSSANPLSTVRIWLVMRHHYGISALDRQRKSFRKETSGGVAKCRLFSQADVHHFQGIHAVFILCRHLEFLRARRRNGTWVK